MIAEELKRVGHQKPFRPYTVKLASGETFRVSRQSGPVIFHELVLFGADHPSPKTPGNRMKAVNINDIVALIEHGPISLEE